MKGKRLDFQPERVTWRMRADDMDLLRTIHPDVNEFARAIIHEYCTRLRTRMNGAAPSSLTPLVSTLTEQIQ
jgi:hypothetical protein